MILGSYLYASIKPISILIWLFIKMNFNMLSFLKVGGKVEGTEETETEKETHEERE